MVPGYSYYGQVKAYQKGKKHLILRAASVIPSRRAREGAMSTALLFALNRLLAGLLYYSKLVDRKYLINVENDDETVLLLSHALDKLRIEPGST